MSTDELADITAELTPPFAISKPTRQTSPLVFCSPHSGAVYTDAFLARSRLDPLTLRKSEDSFVDDLFRDVVQLGAPMIAARFPRAYLDVNREPFELDPALFEGPLPPFANTSSLRVASGLGTIARIVADGEDIYASRFGVDVALMRIEMLYKPFHEALTALIEETRTRFGAAILIDCHSMPSASSQPASGPRADFVLGDRFGAACDARLTRSTLEIMKARGYRVQVNRPYAGGFITEHYGRPQRNVHALQIEINRGLYMNEARQVRSNGFAAFKAEIRAIAAAMAAVLPAITSARDAAE